MQWIAFQRAVREHTKRPPAATVEAVAFWGSRAWVALVAAIAVVLTACSGQKRAVDPQFPAGASLPAVTVENNLLMTGDSRFVMRGATAYMLPFYLVDDRADTALAYVTSRDYADRDRIFADMRDAGVNTVRIPVSSEGFRDDAYGLGGAAGYLQRLSAIVASARSAGLRVIVGFWLSGAVSDDLARDYPSLFPFMGTVVSELGSDDVMYEPLNEPLGLSSDLWLSVMSAVVTEWRSDLRYHGVLILDTTGYSWDFSAPAATALMTLDTRLLGGHPNLAFANHRYPNDNTCFCGSERQEWASSVEEFASRFPIVGTEYGIYDATGPAQLGWMRQFLSYVSRYAIPAGFNGAVAFVWDWVDPNSLTVDDGSKLSTYGRVVAAELWSR